MNYDFVLWMLLYPIASSVCGYITFLKNVKYSEGVEGVSAFIELVVYIFVACLLY